MENSSVLSVSTTSNNHHNLNNLPDLLYYYILKNLDLNGLYCLSLVSKRLNSFVKDHKIIELGIGYDGFRGNWLSTIRPTKSGNQLPSSKLSILTNPPNNLLNLKYLKVCVYYSTIRLDDINKFTRLQILEIGIIEESPNSPNSSLQLPELKALCMWIDYGSYSEPNSYVIDTPDLHSLRLHFDDNFWHKAVKFNHPLSIKYLSIFQHHEGVSIFANLECLEIEIYLAYLETADLLMFNNLKNFKFSGCCDSSYEINQLKDLFKSKKNDLEFVLHGVKVKKINKIDEYEATKSILEFQLNNYAELEDDLHFATQIDYNELIRLLPNQPADLFNKFTNIINMVIDSKVEDDRRLIHFIRRCPNLDELEISRSSLNQQFYDQLPSITSLSILRIRNEDDLYLNFEFIRMMAHLVSLSTDQDVLLSKQLNLNNFKRLEEFEFKINNQEIKIRKKSRYRYYVDDIDNKLGLPDHEFINYKKLIKWCNWLRNGRTTSSKE